MSLSKRNFWHSKIVYIFLKRAVPLRTDSVASFLHQVAAWVLDMFSNFDSIKNNKITNNSATTESKKKIRTDLESIEL
jgi:hypothetical protein